ncbi:class I SAM-dependent methyltransferase [bacterium]|nr:MAG: class I SAM-dependent methyltransferase [bacterium]
MQEPDRQNKQSLPPMKSQDYSELEDWPGYFESVLGKGARETLLAAMDSFLREGFDEGLGVDIAAGEGRDTLELLRQGWRVVATDNHPAAFPLLWSRVPETSKSRLTAVEVDFAEMEVPDCDLVNASFALPFCKPEHFPGLWSRIVAAIRPGGRFAGQFFGDRDTWASLPGRTHHSRNQVEELLTGFEIEMMDEEERDDPPDIRSPKHWQMFHVVAKKL